MKEKVDLAQEIIKNEQAAMPRISVTNLEVTVEEGKVYRGFFVMESENRVPIKGSVYSTNDKVGLEIRDFQGIYTEISYYFKGKLATAGSEFEGDFILITDAGEYNIPYHFTVVPAAVNTSIGQISTMEEFTRLYQENRQEAMELFFLPNFAQVFLKHKPEQRAMYHSFMKSRSRSMILEEFLSAAGYKEPSHLEVEIRQIVLDAGKDKEVVTIKLTTGGYIEGQILAEKGQIQLDRNRFTSNDFVDGCLELAVEKNHNYAMGNDVICIRTIRQEIIIPVEWWRALPEVPKELLQRRHIKAQGAELMHNYLFFRTGSIGFEDFAQESGRALDDLILSTSGTEWKLLKLHLLIMEEHMEEAEAVLAELEELHKQQGFTPLLSNYYLYLKAMFYRTTEAISAAVVSIRSFYAVSEHKAEALWMLIYLDREYVYNKRLQYDTIRQLFQEGENSSLLYFEVCEILNENPNYMEELGAFEISIFRWGVRYGYISMSLAYQFMRLALKSKYYNKSIFYIAEKLYKVEPEDRFLQVICSLLIKGNRTGKEYHHYFKKAVEANLKIIGLNEFFIRSMNYQEYEVIPHRVLIYFTYSNSLDSREKAYLYCNILENKQHYDEVFGAYYSKMEPFVEEQLLKGRMNEHLSYLYSYFQKDILEKPENTKAVCDILFYEKLTCKNRDVIGVYAMHPENGEETYYPFSGGFCYVEIPNNRTVLYFVDSNEQRYVADILYQREPFLSLEQFPEAWIRKNAANKRIQLALSEKVDGDFTEKDLPILQRVAFYEEYKPWIRSRAMEKLLVYYEEHQNKEELAKWLERIDFSNVSESFRKRLMDYYMEVGMIENAFFGIELYGSGIMGAVKRLKLASFGTKCYEGKFDETTLYLCYSAFVSKKYNRDTLLYLMDYFQGELEDLLLIWERSRKFALDTSAFEKRILEQSMFAGNDTDGLFPVFEDYYKENPQDEIIGRYLEYASGKERNGIADLPESMHVIIGEEILAGRIQDRETKIHFLYYFASKEQWKEQIKDTIIKIIEEFLQEEFYLPIYYVYNQWIDFPVEYMERTYLTYRGGREKNVVLYYQIEGEEEITRKRYLKEVLPGMYICSMYFYQNDHVNYRLEEDDVVVSDESRLRFETFAYDGEESRFFALNYFSEVTNNSQEMEEFLKKIFFTDRLMKLL